MNLVLGTAVALWSVFSWYAALTRLSLRLRVNLFRLPDLTMQSCRKATQNLRQYVTFYGRC